ncbi:MAG: penicillin-binding protein [Candidatus Magasanikbacteria bacterium]
MPIQFLKIKHPFNRRLDEGREPENGRKQKLGGKKLFSLIGIIVLASFILGTIAVVWISKDLPDPNRLSDRQVAQSTKIYDRTGEHLLYEVYQNQKRTLVELDQMSSFLPKAVVSVEDKKFYEHSGIRVVSIIRAGFNNLIGRKSGSGGASTLTQQLIKITMVGDERSIFRKIKEAVLALRLEKKYTKDEIIKMYLNEIPFGSTNYGVESASQSYFHKKAKDISLSESATLAALIQAPSRYLNDINTLRNRRDTILRLMNEQGYITLEEKTQAQNEALRIYRSGGIMDAPHFVLYVKQLLADQFGEKIVDDGGLKVITTIDYEKQKAAEKIVKENGDKFAKQYNANNAALVALDPKTGQILAMVGSRDFENEEIDGQFNVAILGKRQPGSSFKPFVYAAAFEKGFTPDTVVYDTVTNFDLGVGGNYTPKNYDGKEHGLVTFRKSLQGSLNIPAVKALYLVGTNETIEFAKRFGYTTFTGNPGLTLVLGGAEVNLLEHTNAYATLADNGVYHTPVSILKVTDPKENVLVEWKENSGSEAIKPELAATVSNILSDDLARAYMFGRNGSLTLPGRPVAAKTGTTNDYKDAWTLGYTPSLAAGVWVGNTTPSTMKGGGNTLAGLIWNQFMRESTKNTPVETFPIPPANDATKPVLRGADGGIKLKINTVSGRIATPSTPSALIVEKTYLPPHDILYYVNKDDPRGPALINPFSDPQYQNWENSLADWVQRENNAGREVSFEEPPTEYDDVNYSPELIPQVQIISPTSNEIINGRQIDIEIKATAPRGIKQVFYTIDKEQIGSSEQFPFSFSYTLTKLYSEQHVLKVSAIDDQGNAGQAQVVFLTNTPYDPATFSWTEEAGIKLVKEDFPRTIQIKPVRWDDIKNIKIQLINSKGVTKNIFDFNHKEDSLTDTGLLEFVWKTYPGVGQYTLKATLLNNGGQTEEKSIMVEIK